MLFYSNNELYTRAMRQIFFIYVENWLFLYVMYFIILIFS